MLRIFPSMSLNRNDDNNNISDYINHDHEYLRNKKKQVNVVKYTVEIADGFFAGFKRIIEMDIGIFDCILNSQEVFKILNNYICNHMYFKLLFFLSHEKLSTQMCELNNIKNKMSIDESLYNSESIEFVNTKKLLIYIK
jgi:hypothetical protein